MLQTAPSRVERRKEKTRNALLAVALTFSLATSGLVLGKGKPPKDDPPPDPPPIVFSPLDWIEAKLTGGMSTAKNDHS